MFNIVTIGSATIDVFVKCDEANIVSVSSTDKKSEFMSYRYGSKIDITDFDTKVGGGGVNTAINFANLGYNTSAIFKCGEDFYAHGIMNYLKDKNLDLSHIVQTSKTSTGFSVILVSFQGDRTVLAHRGGNGEIKKEDIPVRKEIYLESLKECIKLMTENPNIDWTIEKEKIKILTDGYVEIKKTSKLDSYLLLQKYPNFISELCDLEISIKDKIKNIKNEETYEEDAEEITTLLDNIKTPEMTLKLERKL